tara:strand:+ start:278 stop:976 length:699 start_codon:yes stop_codon:yes gene_type:complete
MKVTIIIPVYNEKKTILKIIDKIKKQTQIKKQIIIVDDKSTDGTRELIKKKLLQKVDLIIFKNKNSGKGSAIKSAIRGIKGNIVIIQDADLEYSPSDYMKLVKPIKNNLTQVVYGSRVLNKNRYKNHNFTSRFRIFANHILTVFSNVLNNQKLTDAHTCYKVFTSKIFKNLTLDEKRFGFDSEVNSELSKKNIKIIEVPIGYKGRTYEEGKKITFKDGIRTIYVLLKYKFFK